METDPVKSGYKDTINLPVTDFPMKANLPAREPAILERWRAMDLYGLLRKDGKGRPSYVLHDGPPFANGNIHLGHALNKILKDVVVRHRSMTGFDAPYVPGWDCHGLPIEHAVNKELEGVTDAVRIRAHCAAYAQKYIDIQREQFKRLGILGDWERPYVTMEPGYEAEILRGFAILVEKGLVYEALRPVYWSTGCQTALAEAEVEYQDRTDVSVYVRFALEEKKHFLVIWTTTPWTLPANLAVAVHPDFNYVYLKDDQNDVYVVAETRAADFERATKKKFNVVGTKKGRELEKKAYAHPFLQDGLARTVVLGDFVTTESGTGLVHIAPGHGYDDYVVGQKYGLKLLSPVDDRGTLTAEAGVPSLTGVYVFKANPMIAAMMKENGSLIAEENYTHSYPYCWRSKTPIVFRSVKQWFIRVNEFRKDALAAIDKVEWIPEWGKNRIRGSVESRHDWCISRQRTWGVPIPVFYDAGGKALLDAGVIRRFADAVEKEGTDLWFKSSDEEMAAKLGAAKGLKKGQDTLDVWIDSGSSFRAVAQKRLKFPADMYLEGSDQHRGWFQSSLLTSVATGAGVPYKSVLTHGFVVDGEGRKMSKSLGNVISPQQIIDTLGADVLRLWVASALYGDDIRVSKDIFDRLSDSYRKFRNTFKYLLGNLHGFDPAKDRLEHSKMLEVDRWALSRLAALIESATAAYASHQYHKFYQEIYNYCVKDMSALYFDMLKDRLYADARDSVSGRSSRTALFEIFTAIAKMLAPILCYTSEEAWQLAGPFAGKRESVHLEKWPEARPEWRDDPLEARWQRIADLREKVLKALEEQREKKVIGNSLEARVELLFSRDEDLRFFGAEARLLASVFLVSEVAVSKQEASGSAVRVERAGGLKCARCWNWREEVGQDKEFADLCRRCIGVVKGKCRTS